jgi:DNA-binding transcriptional regulator YdaS (Cro superfamily)
MKIRVLIFFRPKTVKVLLARKDKQWGGQRWLAEQLGLSESYISSMIAGREPVPTGRQGAAMNAFRGMSHKRGGRLSWDDLFQSVVKEVDGTATAI